MGCSGPQDSRKDLGTPARPPAPCAEGRLWPARAALCPSRQARRPASQGAGRESSHRRRPPPPRPSAEPSPTGEGLGAAGAVSKADPVSFLDAGPLLSGRGPEKVALGRAAGRGLGEEAGGRGARPWGGAACVLGLPAAALCGGPSAGASNGSRQTAGGRGHLSRPGRPPWQRLPLSAALIKTGPWLERAGRTAVSCYLSHPLPPTRVSVQSVFPHIGSGPQVMGKTRRRRPPRGPLGFLPPLPPSPAWPQPRTRGFPCRQH